MTTQIPAGTISYHVEHFDQHYFDTCINSRTDGRANDGYAVSCSVGSARFEDACKRAESRGDGRVRAIPSGEIVYQFPEVAPDHRHGWEREQDDRWLDAMEAQEHSRIRGWRS